VRLAGALVLVLLAGPSEERRVTRTSGREVEIVAHDYAFTAPTQLAAGRTTFHFENHGKVIHELHVVLLKKETTPGALMTAINTKTPIKPLIETGIGILFGLPGRRSASGLTADLLAGRDYLVICSFQDNPTAPMHSRLGMVSIIHVMPGPGPRLRSVGLDTITGADYAFRTRATLAAGRHTFFFVNRGTRDHELNIALLKRGVSTATAFSLIKADSDLLDVVDEWLGVLAAPPGASSGGALEMTLLPGRDYLIKCDNVDSAGAPAHVHLGMVGVIRAVK
jgi:hypothetical protein